MKESVLNAQASIFRDGSQYRNIIEQRIIRPETIPDFVIPPSLDNIRRRRCESRGSLDEVLSDGNEEEEVIEIDEDEDEDEDEELNLDPFIWRRLPKTCTDPLDPVYSTNADPKSTTALSLYHIRAVSSYAFDTLSELPSVIKNESFFFSQDNDKQSYSVSSGGRNTKVKVPRRRLQFSSSDASSCSNSEFVRINQASSIPLWRSRIDRNSSSISTKSVASTLSTQSSFHGSFPAVFRSNSNIRCQPHYLAAPLGIIRSQSYRSNCSDLNTSQNYLSCLVSPMPDSKVDDLTDNWEDFYICARRRSSFQNGRDKNSSLPDSNPDSSSLSIPEILINNQDVETECSLGEIKVQITYDYKKTELYFQLIRAENFAFGSCSPKSVFAKVSLLPEGIQKQRSRSVKPMASPTFFQTFVFKNIMQEDLKTMAVLVRFYGAMGRLRGTTVLSETRVHLSAVRPYENLHIWMGLRPKAQSSLGKLQLSITLHPPQQRVALTVHETQDVRRLGSMTVPDHYVRIEMEAPNMKAQKTETMVSKGPSNPNFQHTFCFQYSPKDILDTQITLTVFAKRLFGKDLPLGQVRLGHGATENSEVQHWNCVLQKPFSCLTMMHSLSPPE